MNVLGIYGGIGSMLQAAKNEGLDVIGNIEPRDFEDGQTFLHNFPGTEFHKNFEFIHEYENEIDLILGHPSCGSYSAINWRETKIDRNEIENFVKCIQFYKPQFWIMDNLPKMFIDYPASFWYDELSDEYDISPVFVNNRFYGNSQIRKRVYLIGSLKKYKFVPLPGERLELNVSTKDVIGSILFKEGQIENHNDVNHEDFWSAMTNVLAPNKRSTYLEMYEHVLNWPQGKSFKYHKEDGEEGTRIGLTKVRWDKHCSTLSSTARQIHPVRCTPLTIKEQLLIMGYPDDFVIKGMPVREDGTWKIRGQEYHQVNKGVCVQSIQFFINQIKYFYESKDKGKYPEGLTLIESSSDKNVNSFKYQYCQKSNTTISEIKCSICKLKSICRKGNQ